MRHPPDASAVLTRDFLEMRSRILELAASLDRLDRAEGSPLADPRLEQLHRAIDALKKPVTSRAEEVQRIFSLDYDPAWARPR